MSALDLKKKIENLDEIHHKKILEIFLNNNIHVSENRNGCFINISNLDKVIVNKLNDYITYIDAQEEDLNDIEQKKKELSKDYFKKQSKE
tara:strand:- start:294 stop:563 length:270 start_codon:yes stop_codon:yes gene_type:complete